MSEPIQSIAQNNYILATQQEVSHDNSLSGNGTVNSPLGVVPGYNEALLWSGAATTATQTLSENITAFDEIKVYGKSHNNYPWISQVWVNSAVVYGVGAQMWWQVPPEYDISRYCLSGNKIIPMKGSWYTWANGTTATTGDLTGNAAQVSYICKVVGVNRKA